MKRLSGTKVQISQTEKQMLAKTMKEKIEAKDSELKSSMADQGTTL